MNELDGDTEQTVRYIYTPVLCKLTITEVVIKARRSSHREKTQVIKASNIYAGQ